MTLAHHFDSYRSWRDGVSQLVGRLQDWLADKDLLDGQSEQRLQRIRGRLSDDRLVVAFVAEFSRGKSELINALFFADRGGRVLPSSAGRTTMCPTEISWEQGQPPRIALLPIETRAEGTSIADLRGVPEAWRSFPFDDLGSAEAMADDLRRVGEVKRVPVEVAQSLGFAVGDGADGSLTPAADGQVEIPRWRHALINFPHPLLEQGLVVLDTPGLNAIGAEPELTLSLLPSAHAVLFILAADTGVTQTDLTVWREHVGKGPGRLVVLNKIDGLWDGLRPQADIDAEIARQADSCARILELPATSVFAVSAQKGLVAKVNDDSELLARSRLAELEDALARGLLPAKRELVARGTAAEAHTLAIEVRRLLETRKAALLGQLDELGQLRGKNETMVAMMVDKVKAEKETYERGLREYYAVRSVFTQLSDALYAHLGMEALRVHARRTREAMRQASFTPQMVGAMGELFAIARSSLDAAEQSVREITEMMTVMRARFGKAYGVELDPPPPFTLAPRRQELDDLEVAFRQQFGSRIYQWTRTRRTLIQQFFETVASQLRKTFDYGNRDAGNWLRALMAPLENQVREVQRQLKHRLENVRRIHEAADSLEDSIEEMAHAKAQLDGQLAELEELAGGLAATLTSMPAAAPLRVAA
jgi:predicted GTPase